MEKKRDVQKLLLRSLVDNVYDAQSLRIVMGNRLVANLRELGVVDPGQKSETKKAGMTSSCESTEGVATKGAETGEDSKSKGALKEKIKEDADKEEAKLISVILGEFNRVSDVYAEKFNGKGTISKALKECAVENVYIQSELTYSIVKQYVAQVRAEDAMIALVSKEVKKHPMWDAFFRDVKGCGTLMSAVCIAYLDPYKARWPSSFWKYAGLDVLFDENGAHGRCRSDTEMVTYVDKHGQLREKKSLGYNPILKAKLTGVLGVSFLRTGVGGKYNKLYYDYKNRLKNRPDCKDLRDVVLHRRAIRYAIKIFLQDMWVAWRTLEGLDTGEPYAVAKLGMSPHHDPRDKPVE